MEKTNEPRTFEEYNFQEFLKTKKENDTLKNELEEKQEQIEDLQEQHKYLLDLVKVALSKASVKVDDYNTVYVHDNFVGLYNKDNIEEEEQDLVALAKLIALTKAIPEREE